MSAILLKTLLWVTIWPLIWTFVGRRRETLVARGRSRLLVPNGAFRWFGLVIMFAVPPIFALSWYVEPNRESHSGVLFGFGAMLLTFVVYGFSLVWRSCRSWVAFSELGVTGARFRSAPARVRWSRVTTVKYLLGTIVLAESSRRVVKVPTLLDGADALFKEVRTRLAHDLWEEPFAKMERDRRPPQRK